MKINLKILQSRIKLRFLPNVSRMVITKLGYDGYAAAFGILKTKRSMEIEKLRKIQICNSYIGKQYVRLFNYAVQGRTNEFNHLSNKLLKSQIFQLIGIHNASRNWYLGSRMKQYKMRTGLQEIINKNLTELQFTRRWIDKTPGDYARPLGAPAPKWKANLIMRLQIMEIYYNAIGMLKDWQHAGISRRGLTTAWEAIIKKVIKNPYIYEFDLKGFFDSINNQNTLPELEGFNEYFNKLNNSQPTKYELPPEKDDKAVQLYKTMKPSMLISERFSAIPTMRMTVIKGEENPLEREVSRIRSEQGYLPMSLLRQQAVNQFNADHMAHAMKNQIGRKTNLLENYPHLMNIGKPNPSVMPIFNQFTTAPITIEERERGRDNWKGLGILNKGFPQGANTSPFLSCLTVLRAVGDNPNILMYMDDGLLFADSKERLDAIIDQFKLKLETIGCEIEQRKSRYIRLGGDLLKSKFLGIETDLQDFNSKTRKGTSKPLIQGPLKVEDYERMSSYLNLNASTQNKVVNWLSTGKIKNMEKALEWAIQHGFLTNLIQISFEPKEGYGWEQSIKGILNKLDFVESSKKGRFLVGKYYKNQLNMKDLNTFSTYATLNLLRDLRKKGKAGVRNLKF